MGGVHLVGDVAQVDAVGDDVDPEAELHQPESELLQKIQPRPGGAQLDAAGPAQHGGRPVEGGRVQGGGQAVEGAFLQFEQVPHQDIGRGVGLEREIAVRQVEGGCVRDGAEVGALEILQALIPTP